MLETVLLQDFLTVPTFLHTRKNYLSLKLSNITSITTGSSFQCYLVAYTYSLMTYKGTIASPLALFSRFPKALKWILYHLAITCRRDSSSWAGRGAGIHSRCCRHLSGFSTSFSLSQQNILRRGVFTYKLRRKRNRLIS